MFGKSAENAPVVKESFRQGEKSKPNDGVARPFASFMVAQLVRGIVGRRAEDYVQLVRRGFCVFCIL